MDKDFAKGLKESNKKSSYDLKGHFVNNIMELYILDPLNGKHQGDFIKFLLEFSNPKSPDLGPSFFID